MIPISLPLPIDTHGDDGDDSDIVLLGSDGSGRVLRFRAAESEAIASEESIVGKVRVDGEWFLVHRSGRFLPTIADIVFPKQGEHGQITKRSRQSPAVLPKCKSSITACCEHRTKRGCIAAGPELPPTLIDSEGARQLQIHLTSAPRSIVVLTDGRTFVGCEDGRVVNELNETVLEMHEESVNYLLTVENSSVLIAIGSNGTVAAFVKRAFFTQAPARISNALLLCDGDLLFISTTEGVAYCSRLQHSGESVQFDHFELVCSPASSPILDALKVDNMRCFLLFANRTWMMLESHSKELNGKIAPSFPGLVARLRYVEQQEKKLDAYWEPLINRFQTVAVALQYQKSHPFPDQILSLRVIAGSDLIQFAVQLPGSIPEPLFNACVILHIRQGTRHETLTRSVFVPTTTLFEFICDWFEAPHNATERLLPIHATASLSVGFENQRGYSKVIAGRRFDAFDTREMDRSANEESSSRRHGGNAFTVFSLTRDLFKNEVFEALSSASVSFSPARFILRSMFPQDYITVNESSAFRAFCILRRARIQLEIDGNQVELKATCSDAAIAPILREAVWQRSRMVLKPDAPNPYHTPRLAVQRALVNASDAISTFHNVASTGSKLASSKAENAAVLTRLAWSLARGVE